MRRRWAEAAIHSVCPTWPSQHCHYRLASCKQQVHILTVPAYSTFSLLEGHSFQSNKQEQHRRARQVSSPPLSRSPHEAVVLACSRTNELPCEQLCYKLREQQTALGQVLGVCHPICKSFQAAIALRGDPQCIIKFREIVHGSCAICCCE